MNYFDCVQDACTYLLAQDGATTTLDIKKYLIDNVPTDGAGATIIWKQSYVSSIMDFIHENKLIEDIAYTDNGTYRTYYLDDTPAPTYLKRKELVEKLKEHKGRFIGISWVKNDNSDRTINARPQKHFMNNLGYIDVITSKKEYKQVNPKTLYKVTMNGNVYLHKSLK